MAARGCALSGVAAARPLFVRVLAARPTVDASRTRAGARWRTVAAWRAIAAKDRALSMRHVLLRSRLAWALEVFTLLALLSWFAPQPPAGRAALSFGAYLVAMGSLDRGRRRSSDATRPRCGVRCR